MFTVGGCDTDNGPSNSDPNNPSNPQNPGSNDWSGLGSNPGTPKGTAFQFPSGIIIKNNAVAGKTETSRQNIAAHYGSGSGAVILAMTLVNSGSQRTITLPAGLIIICNNIEHQNGILLKKTDIVVPSGEYTFTLDMYCANASRMNTWDNTVFNTSFAVTDNTEIHALINLLVNKKINAEEGNYEQTDDARNSLQACLSEVIYYKSSSKIDSWRTTINGIPNSGQ
jgi:hypothetical protein